MKLEDLQKIENTAQPTAGMGLSLDHNGTIPPSIIASRPQRAVASAALTVANVAAPGDDIVGATLTVPDPGTYLVIGVFEMFVSVAAAGVVVHGVCQVGGTAQAGDALNVTDSITAGTVTQMWIPTITARDTIVKLSAWKSGAGATVQMINANTTLTLFRIA